jgi:hypothetical protein
MRLLSASMVVAARGQAAVPFHYACAWCRDSGTVMAVDTEGEILCAPYAFRCDCGRGKSAGRRYPDWSNADKKRFQAVSR